MKRTIRLTESDLIRLIKRVVSEQAPPVKLPNPVEMISCLEKKGIGIDQIPVSCTGSFMPPTPPDPAKCKTDIESKFKSKLKEISACLGAPTTVTNPNVMY